jgi:phospholipid transport system substrate-binding protein
MLPTATRRREQTTITSSGACRSLRCASRRQLLITSVGLGIAALVGPICCAVGAVDPAAARIRVYCDALLETMKHAKELGVQGRYDKLAPVIRATFDLNAMTRIAVGPDWPSIPAEQQAALMESFARMTIATYANRFDGYAGERFDVDPATETRKADRIVRTKLLHPDGQSESLNYLMRGAGDAWKAVDVYLSGTISELATRRSEFGAILKSGGPQALIDSLQQRSGKLLQGDSSAPPRYWLARLRDRQALAAR